MSCLRIALLLSLVACSHAFGSERFDWESWRELPVLHGGRFKPLDTVAREMLRSTANRATLTDPVTRQSRDPLQLYLTILFEWRGWEHADKGQLERTRDWRPFYFHLHSDDKWDRIPWLPVDFVPLRKALGLDRSFISPLDLENARIEDRLSSRELPFSAWANKLLALKEADQELTELEQNGLDLANRYWLYQNHRMARALEVIPVQEDGEQTWKSVGHLVSATFDDRSDPSRDLRHLQRVFGQLRESFLQGNAESFNRSSREFLASIQQLGRSSSHYPSEQIVKLEVHYNRWQPVRISWLLMFVSVIGMLLYWCSQWKKSFALGVVAYVMGLIAVVVGLTMRMVIAGRPPVTNMYESVVYVGAGIIVFGLVFEMIYRKRLIISAAAAAGTFALVLADNSPVVLDPSMRPLEPVLRNNFWLVTHVMTITLSYAALGLAMAIANITLAYYYVRSHRWETISQLSQFTYRAIQLGVLLLSAGVILGGVWADYSWGRFWGWDPKEVWALIALLGYLAVLHARFVGWVGSRGLAALSIACFALVVMAWYGVNFVLGAGLHSYGFGGGGQIYVYLAVVLQLIFVAASLLRSIDIDDESRWEITSQVSEVVVDRA